MGGFFFLDFNLVSALDGDGIYTSVYASITLREGTMRALLAASGVVILLALGCGSGSGGGAGSGGTGGHGGSAGPSCKTTSDCELAHLCTDGVCVPGCNGGFWCPLGQYCPAGQCVSGCDSFTRCYPSDFCKNGACVPDECIEDQECKDRGLHYCSYEGECL